MARRMLRNRQSAIQASGGSLTMRLLGIAILLAVLVGLALFSFWFRGSNASMRPETPSILDREIAGVQFQPEATANQILAAARADVDSLVAKYPGSASALSASARFALPTGDTERCLADWGESLKKSPYFAEALFGLGMLAAQDDRNEDAAHYFEDIGIIAPGDARVPVKLADALLHAGHVRKAILVLEQHIAVEQSSVDALLLLGQAYEQDRSTERATRCFEQVVKNQPDSSAGHYGLGRAYARSGQKELADEHTQKFRNLSQRERERNAEQSSTFDDSEFASGIASQTYNDIGRVEQQHGDLQAAEAWLLKAAKLAPNNDAHLRGLQSLLMKLGRKSEVIDVVERIVEISPNDVAEWFTLGGLYAEQEWADQAIAAFEKAIDLDPSNELSIQAQQMLDSLK